MKDRYNISLLLLLLFVATLVGCGGGGGGEQPTTVQYTLTTQYVDKNGQPLSNKIVNGVDAFLFVNNLFYQSVSPGTDGKYVVSFDGGDQASLVVLGNVSNDSLKVVAPAVGDNIDNVSVKLSPVTRSAVSGAFSPNYLFYGRFDYTSANKGSASLASISLYNQHARLHVVVNNLQARYGTGNYTLKLEGFRNGITFMGKVSGDSVVYTPGGSFDGSGNYVSEAVSTLPTMTGEYVTLTVYKDGNQLMRSGTDSGGNKVTLVAEDDKALVVDASSGGITLQVVPWSDYIQTHVEY
jgi:hypothetical protein